MLLGGRAPGAHEASEIGHRPPRPYTLKLYTTTPTQEVTMSNAPSSDRAGVRQVIRALRKADHVIHAVEDGASEVHKFAPDASEDAIIAEVMSCDDGYLLVTLPDGSKSHVYFVFGNEPFEVVCDHGVSLEPVLDPLTRSWWD